jgi:hypothetical protein
VRRRSKQNRVGFAAGALRPEGGNGVEFCEADYTRELTGERTDRVLLGMGWAYTKFLIMPIIT